MLGVGLPSARHLILTVEFTFTVVYTVSMSFTLNCMPLGGSVNIKQ